MVPERPLQSRSGAIDSDSPLFRRSRKSSAGSGSLKETTHHPARVRRRAAIGEKYHRERKEDRRENDQDQRLGLAEHLVGGALRAFEAPAALRVLLLV